MKTFARMLEDETGNSAAEYALILGVIGTAIVVAAIFLGVTISHSVTRAANCISTTGGSCD